MTLTRSISCPSFSKFDQINTITLSPTLPELTKKLTSIIDECDALDEQINSLREKRSALIAKKTFENRKVIEKELQTNENHIDFCNLRIHILSIRKNAILNFTRNKIFN